MVVGPAQPFGARLRRYRLAANLTQEELAERAGVSVRGLKYLEQGARRPFPDTVRRLADALGLNGDDRGSFLANAHDWQERTAPAARDAQPARVEEDLPPFVGRGDELDLLVRHLDGAGPPVLLLAGEPGIGKTRLLQEVVRRAPGHQLQALTGGCQRRRGQMPYAPLLDALERDIRLRSPTQLRQALRGCAWLVRLLPELADGPIEPLPTWQPAPEQERRLMFKAAEQFLANVAGPAGALLVLDDLQWAGADALDLLAALVRSPELPVRVLGAYRDTEMHPHDPLSVLLADLAHAGLATHRTLGPLNPKDAAELLDALLAGTAEVGPDLRERVLQRTGGAPFFLLSCARDVRAGVLATGDVEAVPWNVRQGVRQRIAALPMPAREVLNVAAVVGRQVPRGVMRAVVQQPDAVLLAALEVTHHAHLLIEEGADSYRFAHDIIRELVYTELGAARRAALHGLVAAALERSSASTSGAGVLPLDRLAYHYARSEEQDKAVRYLEAAGDRAQSQMAHAGAEGYYRELVTRLDQQQRVGDSARAREKLGLAVRRQGRYAAAAGVYEQAAAAYDGAGDRESLARMMAELGFIAANTDRQEDGLRRLQPLLRAVDTGATSPGTAALLHAVGALLHTVGRYAEALPAFERAVTLARALGDDPLLVEADMRRGMALQMLGRGDEALAVLEEALHLAETRCALVPVLLCLTLHHLAAITGDRGEFAASRRYTGRALAAAEQLDDPHHFALTTFDRGLSAFYAGAWQQARVDLEQAVTNMRRLGTPVCAYPLLHLGRLCLVEGGWDDAVRYLEESMCVAGADLEATRLAHGVLAEREVLGGEPGAARDRLLPLLDRPGLQEWTVTGLLPVLAWALLDLGEVGEAARMIEQAVARARTQHLWIALVEALRVQALVAMRQGDPGEAARSLDEGLALTQRMPYPFAEARLLQVYGRLESRKGERVPGRARLEAALAIFRRLGAHKDIERVEQDLVSLQQPPLQ